MTAELAKQVQTLRKTRRELLDLRGWILLEKLAAWCKGTPPTCTTSVRAIRDVFGWHPRKIVALLGQFERLNILYRERRYQEPTLFTITLERLSESSPLNFHSEPKRARVKFPPGNFIRASEVSTEVSTEVSNPVQESQSSQLSQSRCRVGSVLLPREADPTPTRPKDARQDHEHEGQAEAALPDNWQPSPADIEAVKAARPDLDDVAIERQRQRFTRRASGTATSSEWSRRFIAFAKGGHAKPWNAAPSSSDLAADQPATNGLARSSEADELVQWRARLRGSEPGKPIKFWLSQWGPRPGERGCQVPRALLLELGLVTEAGQ